MPDTFPDPGSPVAAQAREEIAHSPFGPAGAVYETVERIWTDAIVREQARRAKRGPFYAEQYSAAELAAELILNAMDGVAEKVAKVMAERERGIAA